MKFKIQILYCSQFLLVIKIKQQLRFFILCNSNNFVLFAIFMHHNKTMSVSLNKIIDGCKTFLFRNSNYIGNNANFK